MRYIILLLLQILSIASWSQTNSKYNFLSLGTGVSIFDGSIEPLRTELEIGRNFNSYFSSSLLLGYDHPISDKANFTASGYDINVLGSLNVLANSKNYILELGSGPGLRFATINNGTLQFIDNDGIRKSRTIIIQRDYFIFNVTLGAASQVSEKTQIGIKYNLRLIEFENESQLLLKLKYAL